ncbi:NifB/NifX family molybdenum-iron cluster-binding protein [Geotalea toluenoxydans]|uniref:NifB/NifX family molybdenum-iron cluster-binding protein n=1 Tax=Geotalea toluenoxydans TaxID=421624 RepID=UPI000B2593D1|nr:NifB/NifX family molybdenum-iron cluster-binding protein [Geotalea toluenoxydans]
MLIAVASKDGKEINQHFGHAERFLIYDVAGNEAKLVDEKQVERYCSMDQDHPMRAHLLSAIAEALMDCRAWSAPRSDRPHKWRWSAWGWTSS